ncbi:Calcium and integrin-binding family member 3-like [Homarus americanus]|uniref:Calcium and integrin-binding family member 3-like n=1 Tax=Homarus americanus TaxID=6706 RepID=A0A8J5N0K4_HOMAM|nr:Calcium and integrin-binding family member 3-like [Homarus americanus]
MGNKVAAFSEEQLNEYQACTFLTRKNILRAERLFRQISNDRWPEVVTRECASSFSVPYSSLDSLTELKENPFRRRVCQIFSTDGSASLTFDQFLEMFSVFSEHAPRDIKAIYAFRLYDFDSDGYLSEQDLLHTVLEEGDVDCDGRISQSEFIHVILKSPDFVPNFHIRI